MNRDKKITFRVTEDEHKELLEKKSYRETLSEYIRRLILWVPFLLYPQ